MKKTIKEIFEEVKRWGLTALLAFVIFVFFMLQDHWFFAGIALGVFATRNWDIIEKLIREKLF